MKLFIIAEEICESCNGNGIVYDPRWKACIGELGNKATLVQIKGWFSEHCGFYNKLPPEEETCRECDGKGFVRRDMLLQEALAFIEAA